MKLLAEYAEIEGKIKALEAIKDGLRTQIAQELPEEGFKDEKVTAFWKKVTKYTYSPKVEGLTAELKATKKAEEEDGTAKGEETKQLTISVK